MFSDTPIAPSGLAVCVAGELPGCSSMIAITLVLAALAQTPTAMPPQPVEPIRGWSHGWYSRFPPQPTKEPPNAGRRS